VKRRFLLAAVILVLMAAVLSPRAILLPTVEQELQKYVQKEFNAEDVQIALERRGSWSLVLGRVPAVAITIENASVSGLPIDRARLEAVDLRFHPWALFREKEFWYAGSEFLQVSARVTEQGLNEYFKKHVSQVQDLQVDAQGGKLQVRGTLSFLGVPWELGLEGRLEVAGPTTVRVVPTGLMVENAAAPPALVEMLYQFFNFTIDLDQFPFPMEITSIAVDDGGIELVIQEVRE
jgi:hypothetical protein